MGEIKKMMKTCVPFGRSIATTQKYSISFSRSSYIMCLSHSHLIHSDYTEPKQIKLQKLPSIETITY